MFGWVIDKSDVGKPGDFAGLPDAVLDEKIIEQLKAIGVPEDKAKAFVAAKRGNDVCVS
jgi:hypothetical protein